MRARPDGRVVVLGATSATGRAVSFAMARQGLRPVLVGPEEGPLSELAEELRTDAPHSWDVETVVLAGVDAAAIGGLLRSPADVLVSAIRPAAAGADAAVAAVVAAGCGYLDGAWEPGFIRSVFSGYGAMALSTGAVLLPGFGYHCVAGTLAATIAVRRTMIGSRPPARVDIGYFSRGSDRLAAPRDLLLDDSFRFHESRIQQERPGVRVRSFDVGGGRHVDALSVGSAEHFTVPPLAASISEVNVYFGMFGRLTRAAAAAGAVGGTASRLPGLGNVWGTMVRGLGATGPGAAPSESEAGRSRGSAVAETYDADGAFQQRVRVEGPAPSELTASLLAWGAGMLLQGGEESAGVLGPSQAFGTQALIGGCMALGLSEVRHMY